MSLKERGKLREEELGLTCLSGCTCCLLKLLLFKVGCPLKGGCLSPFCSAVGNTCLGLSSASLVGFICLLSNWRCSYLCNQTTSLNSTVIMEVNSFIPKTLKGVVSPMLHWSTFPSSGGENKYYCAHFTDRDDGNIRGLMHTLFPTY